MSREIATLIAGVFLIAPAVSGKDYDAPAREYPDWDVHDDGLLWLKVWNDGGVGDGGGGSGIYPAPGGPANIYAGYFLAGTMIDKQIYVRGGTLPGGRGIGGWRGLTPVIMSRNAEWIKVPSYIKREGTLDSYYRMDDGNAGVSGRIPIECDVHGVSSCLEDYDDFIAFRYHVKNGSSQTLEKTYFALTYDFDIGGSLSYIDDYVGFDAERKMPYMFDDDGNHSYLGLVCVDGPVRGAHTWDLMNDPDTNRYKYAYMEDPNFDCERTEPYDWRVMLSTGPYEIRPGLTKTVTFAVVAGAGLEALRENADAALAIFKTGTRPEPNVPVAFNLAQNRPNPVKEYTKIKFACQVSAKVKLAIYDLAGRRVTTLADRIYQPGTYELEWRPQNVAPGVYLYTLEAATGERFVRAMVVTR